MPPSPRIHGYYKDLHGRTLRVTAVDPGNRQGREVQGRVTNQDGTTHNYATTTIMFRDIWVKEVL